MIVNTMPAAATGRTPIRGAKCEASPAETMIAGRERQERERRPSAARSRARCWMYSVLKKNIANIPEKARNIDEVRRRAASGRGRSRAGRAAPPSATRSRRTPTSSTSATATKETIVAVEPQPCVSALTSP